MDYKYVWNLMQLTCFMSNAAKLFGEETISWLFGVAFRVDTARGDKVSLRKNISSTFLYQVEKTFSIPVDLVLVRRYLRVETLELEQLLGYDFEICWHLKKQSFILSWTKTKDVFLLVNNNNNLVQYRLRQCWCVINTFFRVPPYKSMASAD